MKASRMARVLLLLLLVLRQRLRLLLRRRQLLLRQRQLLLAPTTGNPANYSREGCGFPESRACAAQLSVAAASTQQRELLK